MPLLLFYLNGRRYALHLAMVERVEHMVLVTPLPKAPAVVLGLISVRGQPVPVIATRRRFGLEDRSAKLSDRLILTRTEKRSVALLVDEVVDVTSYSAEAITEASAIVPGLEYLDGILRLHDGLVLISNPDKFLSLEEDRALEQSMDEL